MTGAAARAAVASRLAAAGCVAPEHEADELIDAAASGDARLEDLVSRRVTGEPLAWVTGAASFCGHRIAVQVGVFVPRWQTEALARRAIALLPADGLAVDLCTGSGAVAVALSRAHPEARVVATDSAPLACACARRNGVEVFEGHLDEPLPPDVAGRADVVAAVVPYVPTGQIAYLPRDVREHEPLAALDGGSDGAVLLREAVWAARRLLRPGGALILELGAEQDRLLAPVLATAGYSPAERIVDDEGDLRGIEARLL